MDDSTTYWAIRSNSIWSQRSRPFEIWHHQGPAFSTASTVMPPSDARLVHLLMLSPSRFETFLRTESRELPLQAKFEAPRALQRRWLLASYAFNLIEIVSGSH